LVPHPGQRARVVRTPHPGQRTGSGSSSRRRRTGFATDAVAVRAAVAGTVAGGAAGGAVGCAGRATGGGGVAATSPTERACAIGSPHSMQKS
jgi:hypothetical protein